VWSSLVRFQPDERYYARVAGARESEAWLLTWLPGQRRAARPRRLGGAFSVIDGALQEHTLAPDVVTGRGSWFAVRTLGAGDVCSFGPDHVHDVVNAGAEPAFSLHVYAPRLSLMRSVPAGRRRPAGAGGHRTQRGGLVSLAAPAGARTIDEVLAQARAGLTRLDPAQALEAWRRGTVRVDIRPAAQRAAEGPVPQALVVERNVLERRFDPASDARLPVAGYDTEVVVLCSQGYTSSLAAACLQGLGVRSATDLIGGFHAWKAAGLSIR
jgi:rhodanese-related sulfurtransferase